MTFLTILLVLVAVYLCVCLIAFMGQRMLVYHPVAALLSDPANAGLNFTSDTLTAGDGSRFLLWRIGETTDRQIVVVYFHGNAENISHNIERYKFLNDLGAAVWAVEYRGYAGVGKYPTEKGIELDLDVLADYIRHEFGDRDGRFQRKIVPYGRSLGGAVAAKLARRIPAAGIILESTFSSMGDVARASFPFLPTSILLREHYDSESVLKELSCAKLIMHAPGDGVIPFRLGRKLFDAAAAPKSFVELPGGHNEPLSVSQSVLEPALSEFLAKI